MDPAWVCQQNDGQGNSLFYLKSEYDNALGLSNNYVMQQGLQDPSLL